MCGSLRFRSVPRKTSEIGDPDDGQPEVDVPFGLGVFRDWVMPSEIAGGGQHDEELVAPEDEPGEVAAARAARRQVRCTT